MKERLIALADHGYRVAAIAEKHGEHEVAERFRSDARAIQTTVRDIYGPQNGDIGEPIETVDFPGEEPLYVPEVEPEKTPTKEPEKVPA